MESPAVRVGEGVYVTEVDGPAFVKPTRDVYTGRQMSGALPTSKWWSSAMWKPLSSAMYPHPLAVKATESGLAVDYPEVSAAAPGKRTPLSLNALFREDGYGFVIGGERFQTERADVERYGDWSVELLLRDRNGSGGIRAGLALGSPYVYLTFDQVKPLFTFGCAPDVWAGGGLDGGNRAIAFTAGDRHYGLFAPAGTTWTLDGAGWTAKLPEGKPYMSAAVLPERSRSVFEHFKRHAYAFITDTRVRWSYDERKSVVTTELTVTTTVMEGEQQATLLALYPHQWKYTQASQLPYSYDSPRGKMKLLAGTGFTTEMPYRGLLPFMPNAGVDGAELRRLLAEDVAETKALHPGQDNTYWTGKWLGRLAQLAWLARQNGDRAIFDLLLERLKAAVDEWFREQTDDGRDPAKFFYYDRKWGTLIGYPSGFGADSCLNDHHFHYGYWVYAAAVVAFHDPEWAKRSRMGGMVELLLQDYANWDRNNQAFPFLRHFDPYAGHSWASGRAMDLTGEHGAVVAEPGNNQESSSEAVHAWAAMVLWGLATGNPAIRDTGIYLYTSEICAAEQYCFDVDGSNFPEDYSCKYAAIVYSGGADYRVWWETCRPEEILGINLLPITGASLYLGSRPEAAKKHYESMKERIGGLETFWHDILWQYQALFEPEQAMNKWCITTYTPEFGESRSHTFQWISSLCALGRVDSSVAADAVCYAVFIKEGVRTFVAFNEQGSARSIRFTSRQDGRELIILDVPAHALRHVQVPL
jgi:endoglucanase Acf2